MELLRQLRDCRCIIGERPVWHAQDRSLYYTNGGGKSICIWHEPTETLTIQHLSMDVATMAFTVEGEHSFVRESCVGCGRCAPVCLGNALVYYGREVMVDELLPLLLEDRAFYENSNGGVTLSGGECLLQAEFCRVLLQRLRKEGIHTAVDTCGAVPWEKIEAVQPYTDIFLYDLKAYDEDVHMRCTGQSNRRILDNLRMLDARGQAVEIRIPYVPGYNDDQMEKIAGFVSTLRHVTKVRVLAYHNYAGSKYAALEIKNALPGTLPDAAEIARAQALFA